MYHDENPHRRNLVMASMAFILFCGGGGKFTDGHINLGLVNAELEHPGNIFIIFMIVLLWFSWRFWKSSRPGYFNAIWQEINEEPLPNLIRAETEKAIIEDARKKLSKRDEQREDELGTKIDRNKLVGVLGKLSISNLRISAHVMFYLEEEQETLVYDSDGSVPTGPLIHIFAHAVLKNAWYKNAFADLLLPYILLCIALTSPFWSDSLSSLTNCS